MAAKPSRRAGAAAERGGADSLLPKKGFLSRIGQSKLGRKYVAPAMTAIGLASQMSAEQARERNAQISRLDTSSMRAEQTAALKKTTSKAASSETQRAAAQNLERLRGAKPNPLPPGMDVGSRLAASQARDRQSARGETNGATGELAGIRAGSGPVLLEGPDASYTHREKTEGEQELERQAGMMRTAKLLTEPGGEQRAPEEAGEAPRSVSFRPGPAGEGVADAGGQARGTVRGGDIPEEATAQAFAQARARDARSAQDRARGAVEDAMQTRRRLVKANKQIRNVVKAVQLAGAESILPLITLVIQLNLETINDWVTRVRIPGIVEPEEPQALTVNHAVTGCVDCSCCAGCFISFGMFAFLFVALHEAATDPAAVFDFLTDLVKGLF